jgi:hypothetical protein
MNEINALEQRILSLEYQRIKQQEPLFDVEINVARRMRDSRRVACLVVEKLIDEISRKQHRVA